MEPERIKEIREILSRTHSTREVLGVLRDVPELLSALETSEGVLKDTLEAMGHMQDEVERQAKEIARFRGRDCNATIQLCYNGGADDPFAREELKIVDVGVSDNCYVVESQTVTDLTTDRDEWKRVAEAGTQGMKGLQGIIDKQNDVLDRVRALAKVKGDNVRAFDLNVALNCVCGKKRENC